MTSFKITLIYNLLVMLSFTSCNNYGAGSSQDSNYVRLGLREAMLTSELEKLVSTVDGWDNKRLQECQDWSIDRQEMHGILSKLVKAEYPEEVMMKCYSYPCSMEGKAKEGDIDIILKITPSSKVILKYPDSTVVFITSEPNPLFLSPCDCCE